MTVDNRKSSNNSTNNTISGAVLSSWSRQQKVAMMVSFALLGVLLGVSACSKQSPKPALVSVESSAPTWAAPAVATVPAIATPTVAAVSKKKIHKKRPANVTYSDANSGVSFLYPRKAVLTPGDQEEPDLAGVGQVPMNFVQPGGASIATVALPADSYPNTDFASAFFKANVNHSLSEQECEHFAFVDTLDADGEPIDAEKVKIGATDMEMTSNFSARAAKQAETEYYHRYEKGACYEYILGLGTERSATEDRVEHVNRDQVFARLRKILATLKLKSNPAEEAAAVEAGATGTTGGKE